jgi:hypothetical protein
MPFPPTARWLRRNSVYYSRLKDDIRTVPLAGQDGDQIVLVSRVSRAGQQKGQTFAGSKRKSRYLQGPDGKTARMDASCHLDPSLFID